MNHQEANQIVRDSFRRIYGRTASDAEALFLQAVAWLESNYGRAPGQHARWASEGLYTWGNIEKASSVPLSPPWYPGSDAGNARWFLLRNSDAEACDDMVRNLTKRHWPFLQAIASEGTPEAVASSMKVAPAYYEAPVATYAAGLRNAINAITAGRGIPSGGGGTPLSLPSIPTLLAIATLSGILSLLYTRGRIPTPAALIRRLT